MRQCHVSPAASLRWPVVGLMILALLLVAPLPAQDKDKPKPESKGESDEVLLRIEVTGGKDKKPVDNASVYVRFYEQRRLRRDKPNEMNLKTNPEGIIGRVPPVPKGKVLIQVIAPGWRTFGKWFDVEKDEETIQINLERPRRWY